MLLTPNAYAEGLIVIRASGYDIQVSGETISSVSELEYILSNKKSRKALIESHICLEAKKLIEIMSVLSKMNFTQSSLASYGSSDDTECSNT